jgi:hypothetical protein
MSEIHAAFAANGAHQLSRLDELLTLLMPASQRDKPVEPPLGSGLTPEEYDRAQKLLFALASPEASRQLHEADNPPQAQQPPQPGETPPPEPQPPEPIGPATPEDEDEDEPQPAAERTTTVTRTTTTTRRR